MKVEKIRPNVGNFIESLREIGYSTEVAVADLLDNSSNGTHRRYGIF